MRITTKIKSSWLELNIEDRDTTICYDVWKNELEQFKTMFQDAIDDIDYMIEKTQNIGGDK